MPMKLKSLYPLLVLPVLLLISSIAACGTPEAPAPVSEPDAGTTPDRTNDTIAPDAAAPPVVLFLGDSIAAGFGVQPEDAFPALIQERIGAEGWPYEVVNAGTSGDTSAGGLSRIDWLLDHRVAVLVLELGGNDGLRGLPPDVTKSNLQQIIDRTLQRYPEARIVLAGMQMPPNMGSLYADQFRDLFPDIAESNDAVLIPFLLEGVGGDRTLNQADGIHPTADGHAIIAETVWRHLRPVLDDIHNEPLG